MGLLPTVPVKCVQVCPFIKTVSSELMHTWYAFQMYNVPIKCFYRGLKSNQALLPFTGGFAVGAFSVRDVAIALSFVRAGRAHERN